MGNCLEKYRVNRRERV